MIKAVLFDAVGTVLRPEPGVAEIYRRTAVTHGVALDGKEIRIRMLEVYERQDREDEAAGWSTSEEREFQRWQTVVHSTFHEFEQRDAIFRDLYDWFSKPTAWRLFEDVSPVLAELERRGIPFGLASNYDRRLRSIVEADDHLKQFRRWLFISSEIGVRKPGRGFFEHCVQAMNLQPEEIVFVGDDLRNDFEGAREAGMISVMIDRDGNYPDADGRVATIGELLAKFL